VNGNFVVASDGQRRGDYPSFPASLRAALPSSSPIILRLNNIVLNNYPNKSLDSVFEDKERGQTIRSARVSREDLVNHHGACMGYDLAVSVSSPSNCMSYRWLNH
jgi:hypothetical protein